MTHMAPEIEAATALLETWDGDAEHLAWVAELFEALGRRDPIETRALAALHSVGAPGAHGTSRTTRKPQSAARAWGSRQEREPGRSSRRWRRHDPPRLTRVSPDSGPRGS